MKSIFRIVLIVVVPFLVAFLVFRFMTRVFLDPMDPGTKTPVLVEIEPGKSFRATCKDLESKGLVRYWWSLELLARIRKSTATVNAGEYEVSPNMTPSEILQKLVSGDTFKRRITVKEGMSIWDIGDVVETAGLIKRAEFEQGVMDPGLLGKAGIESKSFEGYLFPETYQLSRPLKAEQVIWKMLEEGEKHWTAEFSDQADNLRLSRHEILTLASIIEKESGVADEQPIISSVLHNRLRQGMKLQVDATVIYGIADFNGNLTKQDLERPGPYNTYLNFGLPPGPIGNPGSGAIRASLFPNETTFLYFVADGKGRHVFSTTLEEHNEAVKQFQLKGGK